MSKKQTRKPSHNRVANLQDTILSMLKKDRNATYNYKQIASKLNITDASGRNQIIKKLAALKLKGDIEEIDRGKFKAINNTEYYTGILDLTSKGSGYVICEEFTDDVFISSNNINRALNGDEVELYVYKRRKNGRMEGEITNVISRKKSEFVGVIQIHEKKNFAFVVPDDHKMPTDIFVPINKTMRAEDGEKVLVKLEEWPEKASSPNGSVIRVLGKPGLHSTEIHSIFSGMAYLPNSLKK